MTLRKTQQSTILVTGVAGFIGFHTAVRLLERGERVIGLDNVNNYYDVRLKKARLAKLKPFKRFTFTRTDLADRVKMHRLFARQSITKVIHLAAQAGVRYSLVNPHAYTDSNIEGFLNILEGCRHANVDHPVSLYAASKKANELMAHCYAHLYRIPCTGLRFFTVYGPWGRPDMALFLFTKAILEGKPIEVFNHGRMQRDFTYIDDVVEGVVRTLDHPATPNPIWSGDRPDPGTSSAPARIYNIGNHEPVELLHFIEVLENALGKKAEKKLMPLQPGDVPATYANVDDLIQEVGFAPATPIEEGIARFVKWYREFYKK